VDDLRSTLEGIKGWGGWGLCLIAIIWWIRGIPERRRAANEGDASLRSDLLQRIRHLEDALAEQQRKCAEEQAQLRREMQAQIDGLVRMIAQNSKSTAMLLGDLGGEDMQVSIALERAREGR